DHEWRPVCNHVYHDLFFFFSSRRRHTRCYRDWSSDVCSSDLVVGHDDELARADVFDRLLYLSVRHSCLTYLPSTSPSTCTRSPGRSASSVVCPRVNGIRDTWTTPLPGSAFTVRLTPSTVIEPCRIH